MANDDDQVYLQQLIIRAQDDGTVGISFAMPNGKTVFLGYDPITAKAVAAQIKKCAEVAQGIKFIRPNHN